MEMSQRIHFLILNFTKNVDFLTKRQKITFLVKKKFVPATKVNFELKMMNFGKNHVKTNL